MSSVYGFIMIYLLVIASLQAFSVALSSSQQADEAAQQAQELAQTRSLERLSVELRGGNVTITNTGLIPSEVSLLLIAGATTTREMPVDESLQVGSTIVVDAGSDASSALSVAAVTTLGNVFASSAPAPSQSVGVRTLASPIGGPGVDAQVYQNPSDPTRFFLADGPSATAYSTKTGTELWTFDAGEGEVTDVFPLSNGGVYVSDGYYGDQFTSTLYQLASSGATVTAYTMRLLRLYTTVVVQYPNNEQPPYPVGSQPVEKGLDSLYAYYDGWFLSAGGPSSVTVPSDTYEVAGSDPGDLFLYSVDANAGGFGCSEPHGNYVTFYDWSATSSGVVPTWSSTVFFDLCNLYPNDMVGTAVGSGLLASVFSDVYWTQPNYYGGPYEGTNPYLFVLSSTTGNVLRSGELDSSGYTGVATDGTNVYLAIPSSDEVEVVSATGSGPGTFYDVGIPATTLTWYDGSLFAISPSQVNVYGPSMRLAKSIEFGPDTLYSLSNSKSLEPQMVSPSFIVLNSTSYLALVRNSTGYGSLLLGGY